MLVPELCRYHGSLVAKCSELVWFSHSRWRVSVSAGQFASLDRQRERKRAAGVFAVSYGMSFGVAGALSAFILGKGGRDIGRWLLAYAAGGMVGGLVTVLPLLPVAHWYSARVVQ